MQMRHTRSRCEMGKVWKDSKNHLSPNGLKIGGFWILILPEIKIWAAVLSQAVEDLSHRNELVREKARYWFKEDQRVFPNQMCDIENITKENYLENIPDVGTRKAAHQIPLEIYEAEKIKAHSYVKRLLSNSPDLMTRASDFYEPLKGVEKALQKVYFEKTFANRLYKISSFLGRVLSANIDERRHWKQANDTILYFYIRDMG